MSGIVVGKVGHPGTLVSTTTEKFILTPAQIMSLNSLPVDLVVTANANQLIVPGPCVFVGKEGSVAYSAAPNPQFQYTGALLSPFSIDETGAWDGSASAATLTDNAFATFNGDATGGTDILTLLGVSLQITSGADVTTGDAPFTFILTYTVYDLTGLL